MTRAILVSGASGFIAAHAVEQLLARGDLVTGTVRDPKDAAKCAPLRQLPGAENLTLVAADLNDPDPFTAHADADAVLHIASPYVVDVKDPRRDLVDPAVQGTLRMLRAAAANPRVKRVVLTSSMAAVTDYMPDRVLTEADWNSKSSLTRNPYHYSKVLAERAAWDFIEREKPGFDLVVLNPFMVIGPSHTKALSTSPKILADIINGVYPVIMDLTWGVVDVRDVAAAHLAALDRPAASGRYLLINQNRSAKDLIAIMRAEGYQGRIPSIDLSGPIGTALARLAALAQPPGTRAYLRTTLGRVPRYDNSKAIRELGITWRDPDQTIRDTLADLAKWGHIPAPQ